MHTSARAAQAGSGSPAQASARSDQRTTPLRETYRHTHQSNARGVLDGTHMRKA